jgi:hypothetical protein
MAKRVIGLILIWVMLGGCTSAGVCDGAQPESVLVDGSAFVNGRSEVEACIIDDERSGTEDCSEPGTPWVSVTWHDEYPVSVDYRVTRAGSDGVVEIVATGGYELQCVPGTVRIEVGVRPEAD